MYGGCLSGFVSFFQDGDPLMKNLYWSPRAVWVRLICSFSDDMTCPAVHPPTHFPLDAQPPVYPRMLQQEQRQMRAKHSSESPYLKIFK